MNNFSELQATDLSLDLLIELTPHYKTHAPEIVVCTGGVEWYAGTLNDRIQLTGQLPLLSTFDIVIHLQNKNNNQDSTTAAIITKLSVDKHSIVPNWTHLADYSNDHNFKQPTTHLGFNGVWKLTVDKPFYQWWHINTGQGKLLAPS
jgi:hypothetical protein